MSKNGTCKLCLIQTELKQSHVIQNTYFRQILRAGNGNGIKMVADGETEISYSSDSAKELMLCEGCETHINRHYESHADYLFNIEKNPRKTTEKFVSFGAFKPEKLILFYLSILWRAANSSQELYENVNLSLELNEALRVAVLNTNCPSTNFIGVKCHKLTDLKKENHFTEEQLLSFISVPSAYVSKSYKTYFFCFAGIYAEIRIGGFTGKARNEAGVLLKKSKVLVMPYINIFDIPQFEYLLKINYLKQQIGKSKIN